MSDATVAVVMVATGVIAAVGVIATFGVAVARWVEEKGREPPEPEAQDKRDLGAEIAEQHHAQIALEHGFPKLAEELAKKHLAGRGLSEPAGVFEDRRCAACGHPDDSHFEDGCFECQDAKRCMKFVKKTGAQKKLEANARTPLPDAERRSLSEELSTRPDPKATVVGHRVWNKHVMYGPENEYVLSDGRVVRWDSCVQYWYPSGARVADGDHQVVRQINQYEAELERAERLNKWKEKA